VMQNWYELKQKLTPIGPGKDDDQQPEPVFSPDNGARPHVPGSKITDQRKEEEAGEQGSGFKFQVSGFKFQVYSRTYLFFGVLVIASQFRFQVSGSRFKVQRSDAGCNARCASDPECRIQDTG